jgi:hypothetical protein
MLDARPDLRGVVPVDAIKIADAEMDGTYEHLVAGYREGRTTFGVKRDGMTVLEDAPVPPPTDNSPR